MFELFKIANVAGLGYAFFVAVRCICLQVCIGFFGKAGRSVLKAVVLGLVIAGNY